MVSFATANPSERRLSATQQFQQSELCSSHGESSQAHFLPMDRTSPERNLDSLPTRSLSSARDLGNHFMTSKFCCAPSAVLINITGACACSCWETVRWQIECGV